MSGVRMLFLEYACLYHMLQGPGPLVLCIHLSSSRFFSDTSQELWSSHRYLTSCLSGILVAKLHQQDVDWKEDERTWSLPAMRKSHMVMLSFHFRHWWFHHHSLEGWKLPASATSEPSGLPGSSVGQTLFCIEVTLSQPHPHPSKLGFSSL